jgi:hypothetical protein
MKLKHLTLLFLTMACLVMAVPTPAFAVPPTEVLRVEQNQSFQGSCCFSWLEKVSITEPAKVEAVTVTWSGDYQATGYFFIGFSLNGGVCQFYGSAVLAPTASFDNFFDAQMIQGVIEPGDGLMPGKNTFTLCGGGMMSPSDIVTLGFNTMSVRISK